jgi:DNA-binding transcriptional ArsR family regulator
MESKIESKQAVRMLFALAQDTRLQVFRLLVRAGPEGMAAGSIGAALKLPPATLSFHLKELSGAGLVVAQPVGRSIIYAAALGTMADLLGFLTDDCCGGEPCGLSPVSPPARRTRAPA